MSTLLFPEVEVRALWYRPLQEARDFQDMDVERYLEMARWAWDEMSADEVDPRFLYGDEYDPEFDPDGLADGIIGQFDLDDAIKNGAIGDLEWVADLAQTLIEAMENAVAEDA